MPTLQPIRATLEKPEQAARLRRVFASGGFSSRAAAARSICEEFDFRDFRGLPRISSCTAALRAMEKSGRISLPEPQRRGRRRPGLPSAPACQVPPATGVPGRVDLVERLEIIRVEDGSQARIWNGLVAFEHPLGAANQAGCQIRYLIGSAHGWLGAAGFSSPALKLKARDAWVGWDDEARAGHVHLTTGLSRFLIRPGFRCENLASKALALCLRRLGGDFEARYGFRPLLAETFVSPGFEGTCLLASGWTRVGETAGRGRFAETGAAVPAKAIWMRPLARGWRHRLGVRPPPRPEPLACGEGLDRACWAENEFGGAPLGDERLSKRLVKSAAIMADDPGASFVGAAATDHAAVTGFYRMIEHPPDSEVTPENILAPHRERTLRRIAAQKTALLIQDGTDLNFATHPRCGGLGLISRNKGSAGTLGLHMHTTLALAENGVPLGIPRIEFDAPDGKGDKGKPAEERKSARWLRATRDCSDLKGAVGNARLVSVMDREADFFGLFAERERLGNIDLLVRAKNNRSLGAGLPKLFDAMRAKPPENLLEIHVARSSARNSARGQKAKAAREARVAEVALSWERVELPPPSGEKAFRGLAPVRLWAVHVHEKRQPADGSKPLEWLLLTSVEVKSRRKALQVLDWYRLRWRIEDWHKILKSGCKAEYLGLQSGERIERAVTIKAVIAWRLAAMVMMGRETPELPAEILFSDFEIIALNDFAKERKLTRPDNLGNAMLVMAMIGGYLNRKHDWPPGNKIMWEGYIRLVTRAQTYQTILNLKYTSDLFQKLRPDKGSG